MYKSKRILMLFAVLIFSGSNLFAQVSDQATTSVEVKLMKGLSITPPSVGLVFDDKVIGVSNETINATNPVAFMVTGEGNKSILVDYSNTVTLNDGGTNNLTFTPFVEETADNPAYTGGSTVGDNSSATLTAASGILYLWLGGSIDITPSTVAGDYAGTFTIDVAYN